jgi:hypothetical protein
VEKRVEMAFRPLPGGGYLCLKAGKDFVLPGFRIASLAFEIILRSFEISGLRLKLPWHAACFSTGEGLAYAMRHSGA